MADSALEGPGARLDEAVAAAGVEPTASPTFLTEAQLKLYVHSLYSRRSNV
jgi:hypothetical protein